MENFDRNEIMKIWLILYDKIGIRYISIHTHITVQYRITHSSKFPQNREWNYSIFIFSIYLVPVIQLQNNFSPFIKFHIRYKSLLLKFYLFSIINLMVYSTSSILVQIKVKKYRVIDAAWSASMLLVKNFKSFFQLYQPWGYYTSFF